MRPYHARLRREVERFGGTVEKFIGDAVMAVFGAPVTHEDDPERGVRAALRILEAIADLNEEDAELSLAVPAVVSAGEVVVAMGARPERGEGLVVGDVVNTASRLQGAAPIGGVLVGPETYAATCHVFDYQQLAAVVLKGKAEPVLVFQALAPRARLGADLTRVLATPMVGRPDRPGHRHRRISKGGAGIDGAAGGGGWGGGGRQSTAGCRAEFVC